MNKIIDILKRNRIQFLVITITYPILFAFLINYMTDGNLMSKITGRYGLEKQISSLNKQIDQLYEMMDVVKSRDVSPKLFKNIDFIESWESEKNKIDILRLIEYANFAKEKKDYERAESMYKEALQIQNSLQARYELAILYYIVGDLKNSFDELNKIYICDNDKRYILIRFYLAMINFELENYSASNHILIEYLFPNLEADDVVRLVLELQNN